MSVYFQEKRVQVCLINWLQYFRGREWDFDVMMAKKKEEMSKRRKKRKDFDLINDSDDLIAEMINKMKVAAEVCIMKTFVYMTTNLFTTLFIITVLCTAWF